MKRFPLDKFSIRGPNSFIAKCKQDPSLFVRGILLNTVHHNYSVKYGIIEEMFDIVFE